MFIIVNRGGHEYTQMISSINYIKPAFDANGLVVASIIVTLVDGQWYQVAETPAEIRQQIKESRFLQ